MGGSPVFDRDKQLIVTLPKGVGQTDLQGLLNGFSKATEAGGFHLEKVPDVFGGMKLDFDTRVILLPFKRIRQVSSKMTIPEVRKPNEAIPVYAVIEVECSPSELASLMRGGI